MLILEIAIWESFGTCPSISRLQRTDSGETELSQPQVRLKALRSRREARINAIPETGSAGKVTRAACKLSDATRLIVTEAVVPRCPEWMPVIKIQFHLPFLPNQRPLMRCLAGSISVCGLIVEDQSDYPLRE
jgi:hypothetical protein